MPPDHVQEGQGEKLEDDDHEERERDRPRLVHASAPPGDARDDEDAWDSQERVPRQELPDVAARVVRELVGEHEANLVALERAGEERVPQDHTPARADPAAPALGGLVTSLTVSTRTGMSSTPCASASSRASAAICGSSIPVQVGNEVGKHEREEQSQADEDRSSQRPPVLAGHCGERHHDQDRE